MLKAEDVETAFVETAHQQEGGAFNWQRLTQLLNERLADERGQHSPFLLDGSVDYGVADWLNQ